MDPRQGRRRTVSAVRRITSPVLRARAADDSSPPSFFGTTKSRARVCALIRGRGNVDREQPRTVALAAHYLERLAASSRAAVAPREFCAPIVVDEREVVARLSNIN